SVAFLREKRMLIVFDNCEHVVEATAHLIERLSAVAHDVHVLTTSCEPLRHAGERVQRLPPLACPPPSERLTAAEALTYPWVELFVVRFSAGGGRFGPDDDEAPAVATICRTLDGIPLAIELAAGRFEAFGIEGLAARLNDPFRLLNCGRRTADA